MKRRSIKKAAVVGSGVALGCTVAWGVDAWQADKSKLANTMIGKILLIKTPLYIKNGTNFTSYVRGAQALSSWMVSTAR